MPCGSTLSLENCLNYKNNAIFCMKAQKTAFFYTVKRFICEWKYFERLF